MAMLTASEDQTRLYLRPYSDLTSKDREAGVALPLEEELNETQVTAVIVIAADQGGGTSARAK